MPEFGPNFKDDFGCPRGPTGATWTRTRADRIAARERVRQLVDEHDDQLVMLIWDGRILGWSLRKITAALEGSITPLGQRAGYTAGAGSCL